VFWYAGNPEVKRVVCEVFVEVAWDGLVSKPDEGAMEDSEDWSSDISSTPIPSQNMFRSRTGSIFWGPKKSGTGR
jgi:hypothetical protein